MSRGFNVKMRQVACVEFYGKENGPIFIPPPPQKKKKWLFFRRHLCFFTTMLAAKNCTHIKLAHFREQGNLSPCSRLLISLHLHESLVSEPCVSCKYLFLAAAAVPKD